MKPLVSIIIPAYNAEKLISQTLRSAVAQTWPRKEIIVVNDGSTDRTLEVARQFCSRGVSVVSTENRGLSAAVNYGYRLCQGDYIQELDADDILKPDKIERQLSALRESDNRRILPSSPWAPFYYRTSHARFVRTSLCEDLSPVEWLLRKMGENLHMQNATWLVSRELAEAAGPWDEDLQYDQDGEYFARVVMASEGTRFVPGTGVYYRIGPPSRISYIGNSDLKKDSMLRSMKLHVRYLRSLEESERVRKASVTYMQNWYWAFYPERHDILAELHTLATELGGQLSPATLDWRYAWVQTVFGRKAAKATQTMFADFKTECVRRFDKAVYNFKERQSPVDAL
jgi:glycosyltransferase involved in cell wall biosynthesis